MQLDVIKFLRKLASEAQIMSQVRAQVQAEIEKYEGMRLVLSSTSQNPEFTGNLLSEMDANLADLKIIAEKIKYPHLVLLNKGGVHESAINQLILQILKEINRN